MKRLHDFGYTASARDTSPGAAPPARRITREAALNSIRADVEAAKAAAEAARRAGIEAEARERAAADAARERQLAVAKVLATM